MTFWAADVPSPDGPTVVRIRGRRLHAGAKSSARDSFVRDEQVGPLPAGSGPFSISVKVADVNPGDWSVSAEVVPSESTPRSTPKRGGSKRTKRGEPLTLATWSRRRLSDAQADSVTTTTTAAIRRPGIVRGGWAAMVGLALVSALVLQQVLLRSEGMPARDGLALSLVAAFAGGVGAKAWYIFLDRKRGRWNGWCIQGFVAALVPVLLIGAPLIGVPVGGFLDLSTPALFLGMSIGRLGCILGGCCGGRPTCSRLGVWISDQRIGVRRIPTQLLESSLSLTTAVVTYALVATTQRTTGGVVFVGAIAAYTLFRQALLKLRAEARRTTTGSRVTAGLAVVMLVGAVVLGVA
ncbi:MAG: prolipoprotein diacylglyceryl transferase family protein [Acidimicrobiia bacterium]